MWRSIRNTFRSLASYEILSPDICRRYQVSRWLSDRPTLPLDHWYVAHWDVHQVSYDVVAFVYTYLKQYSGLPVGQLFPEDRLEADLFWTEICWFDWEWSLCDDFQENFECDISDRLNTDQLNTIRDLVLFLDDQFLLELYARPHH
ncbi:MAG: hypothetical protein VKK04_26550 [Synechococcales bacterium]|nr:hypothetical protein [Synechococcales bacterium]